MYEKFSVILPIYWKNQFSSFQNTFQSILNQTYKPSEIIIVFDGKVEKKIKDYIKKKKKIINIKEIKNVTNLGLGKSLNKAVKICSYNLIARTDCDDLNYKDRFKKQISYMKLHNLDVCGSSIIEFSSISLNSMVKKNPLMNEQISRRLKYRNPFNHQTVLFKKKSVLKAGNYKDVPFFEDYYLWVRMKKKGSIFGNLNKILVRADIDKNFYDRRSGISYLRKYQFFLSKCKKIGYINNIEYFYLLLLRTSIYLFPGIIVKFFYQIFLRK